MENSRDRDALYEELSSTIKFQINKLQMIAPEMKEHVHSVPKIAKQIAKKLNLNEEGIKFCIKCAYLHDVGKLFIPLELLEKKDKLNFFEKRKMREHTLKGYELCMSTASLTSYANGARSHHENERGNGYPDGLTKGSIPLEAEIIKVSDIYDTVCLRREYKPELSRVEALSIIQKEVSKKLINTQVFNALLEVVEDELREEVIEAEDNQEFEKREKAQQEMIEIMRLRK